MNSIKKIVNKSYRHFMHDSLYRNSIYLMISTAIMALGGFIFWTINARIFSVEQVGLATSAISAAALISNISLFGLDNVLIKFLPSIKDKKGLINDVMKFLAFTTFAITLITFLVIHLFIQELSFLYDGILVSAITVLLIVALSLNTASDNILTAYKSSVMVLYKNTLLSALKLCSPFIFIAFGAYGIFLASSIPVLISFLFAVLIIKKSKGIRFSLLGKISSLGKYKNFAFANYMANSNANISTFLIPLIILAYLGAEYSAYYFVAMMLATLVFVIPLSVGLSLLAEGSYEGSHLKDLLKPTIKRMSLFLIPAILIMILLGKYILAIFGSEYAANSYTLLIVLVASAPLVAINYTGNSLLNLINKPKILFILNLINMIAVLLLSLVLVQYGLLGIGIAWLIGQLIPALGHVKYLRAYL